jgi:hypothetical protein
LIKKIFKRNISNHRPLLIKGFAKQWGAYEKWNLDYIREKAGDQVVPSMTTNPLMPIKALTHGNKMKMKDYIDIIKSKPSDLRSFLSSLTGYQEC